MVRGEFLLQLYKTYKVHVSVQLIDGLRDIPTGLRNGLEFLPETLKQTVNILLGCRSGGSCRFPGSLHALIVGDYHAIESDLSGCPGAGFLLLGASWCGIEVTLECINVADRLHAGG
jgi:hypothetical protein